MSGTSEGFEGAAAAIRRARALVVATGAGMGVDSGLPDFRGDQGFWKAYPAYERLGLSFVDAANPERFEEDPAFGWGFYGHRLHLYRDTRPHDGYRILRSWMDDLGIPAFAVTSNVDGQFQKAGFDGERIHEVHGSIHHLQCTVPCGEEIWPCDEDVPVDVGTMRALHLPGCRSCRRVARPNILMFGDGAWLPGRSSAQARRFDAFLEEHGEERLAVLEIGAGTAVATIRWMTERLGRTPGTTVIRVNPREADIRAPHLAIPGGALESLQGIDRALRAG
jgi:NAD-dependent SIR2 family protein deacetylase